MSKSLKKQKDLFLIQQIFGVTLEDPVYHRSDDCEFARANWIDG